MFYLPVLMAPAAALTWILAGCLSATSGQAPRCEVEPATGQVAGEKLEKSFETPPAASTSITGRSMLQMHKNHLSDGSKELLDRSKEMSVEDLQVQGFWDVAKKYVTTVAHVAALTIKAGVLIYKECGGDMEPVEKAEEHWDKAKAVWDKVNGVYKMGLSLMECGVPLVTCLIRSKLVPFAVNDCFDDCDECLGHRKRDWNDFYVAPNIANALDLPENVAASVVALSAAAAHHVYNKEDSVELLSLDILAQETIDSKWITDDTDKVALYQNASNKVCFLAFSGSDDRSDWKHTNFQFKPDGSFCGQTGYHDGYAKEINNWMDNAEKFQSIRNNWGSCDSLYLVGHSMGGAIASMLAECMNCDDDTLCNGKSSLLDYPREARLITFGAPAYRKTQHPTTLKGVRFWNREDTVPVIGLWPDNSKPMSKWLEEKEMPFDLQDYLLKALPDKLKDLPQLVQYHHPTIMAVGMEADAEEVERRSVDSAIQATLTYKDQESEILPAMFALMAHFTTSWTYPHSMYLYRGRLNMLFSEKASLQFYGNGCCRFDGWKATHQGMRSPKDCLEDCAGKDNCLAADLARPSESGNVSDCYLFSGSGHNFGTECGQGTSSEKCYTKEKVAKAPLQFYGQGCCRYDDWRYGENEGKGIPRWRQTQNKCTDICASDAQCIATEVARPGSDGKYDCFSFYGLGNNFHTECDKNDKTQRCFRKRTMTLTIASSTTNKKCVTEGTADCAENAGDPKFESTKITK